MKESEIRGAIIAASILNKANEKKNSEASINFRATAKKTGLQLKEIQCGYMDAGFSERQAFQLMIHTLTFNGGK